MDRQWLRASALCLWVGLGLGCSGLGAGRLYCAMSCSTNGRCTPSSERIPGAESPYRCYAASDAGCRGSQICRDLGRCSASERGTCVTDATRLGKCAGSFDCTERGDCHPQPAGFCAPESDADCQASNRCKGPAKACTHDPVAKRCVP